MSYISPEYLIPQDIKSSENYDFDETIFSGEESFHLEVTRYFLIFAS